jgi:uncharacterized membrane protein YqaE (UPF0057 family)
MQPSMSLLRVIVCIVLPPAAVLDKGCGPIVLTTVLRLVGWVPGIIAAIIFCTRPASAKR